MEANGPQKVLARSLVAATLLATVASGLLELGSSLTVSTGFLLLFGFGMLATAGLGHLLVVRKGHPVGWMLLSVALLQVLLLFFAVYSTYGARPDELGTLPGADVAAWATDQLWLVTLALSAIFIPLVFPDGHLPSPRWRHVLRLAIVAVVLAWVPIALEENLFSYQDVPAPLAALALPDAIDGTMYVVSTALAFVALAAALSSPIVRWRRGSAVERQQLKWLFAAVVLLVFTQVAVGIIGLEGFTAEVLTIASVIALPGAMAAAIMRYRLFDIDRLFRRTLGYLLSLGVLAGIFISLVLSISQLVPAARDSNLVVSFVTVVAMLVTRPIHQRIKRGIDRRFNRRGYLADDVVARLHHELGDQIDVDAVVSKLVTTISTALEPATVSVYVHDPA